LPAFQPEGLNRLATELEIVADGSRTRPTATLLVTVLEHVKLWMPGRWMRAAAHFVLGWLLFPMRYLDAILLRSPRARQPGKVIFGCASPPVIELGTPGRDAIESAPKGRTAHERY
jgi:hypothetical protein